MTKINTNQSNNNNMGSVAKHYIIRKSELPLSCPPKDKEGWSLHPRVYLPIKDKGEITCPYCGSKYVLEE